jgi:AcrR family transcriptional regulator
MQGSTLIAKRLYPRLPMARQERDDKACAEGGDSLREQLLEAAARVFASKGYSGTKLMDIVREAGLSSGAIYGRFNSKKALLIEAIVSRHIRSASEQARIDGKVADSLIRTTTMTRGPLSNAEAIRLEAYVTARREPEVAEAIAVARRRWQAEIQPVVKAALADGTVPPDADVDSVLYFLETFHLGLLLQRAVGRSPKNARAWATFMSGIVRSMARSEAREEPD